MSIGLFFFSAKHKNARLTSKTVSQMFGTSSLFFYKKIELEKGKE